MQDIDWEKHISVDPEICHGKPRITGLIKSRGDGIEVVIR